MDGQWKFQGGVWSQKPKFSGNIYGGMGVGGGVKPQKHPWGGMDIFWNNIPVMYGHSQKSEKGFTLI